METTNTGSRSDPVSPSVSPDPATPHESHNQHSPTFLLRMFRSIRHWSHHHQSEILWAALFAVVVAWLLDPPKPHPYTIYVVVDHRTDPETRAVFDSIEQNSQTDALNIGDVPVQVKVETLDDAQTSTAVAKANELVNRPDTLLVIGHLPSPLIEESLFSYLHANPPVPILTTTASDEDLLVKCRQRGLACFQDGWFAPLLQLSPTNKEQGRAAIRFATQNLRNRFLIVTENDFNADPYARDLIQAYHDAIDEFNDERKPGRGAAGVVGKYKLEHLPDKALLSKLRPDCVLYAGELETAHGLLNRFPEPQPMVILSDSTLESRLSDNALSEFTPMRFTYQTDAADYNDHTNVYGLDAYWIARQLIGDLNNRGGDLRYWFKSLLHFHAAKDARRSLVRVMEENSTARTWYRGHPGQQEPGATYVFSREKRVDGMFHVWQLKKESAKAGSEMIDIDNWHPPRMSRPRPISALAN